MEKRNSGRRRASGSGGVKRGYGPMSVGGVLDEQHLCFLAMAIATHGPGSGRGQGDSDLALALLAADMITKKKKKAAAAAATATEGGRTAGGTAAAAPVPAAAATMPQAASTPQAATAPRPPLAQVPAAAAGPAGGAAAATELGATTTAAAATPPPSPPAAPAPPGAAAPAPAPPAPPAPVPAATTASGDRTPVPNATTKASRGDVLIMDHIVEEEAMAVYCFTKADLRRLYALLQFPSVWVCKNGSRFPGETAFILLFLRLRHAGRMSDLAKVIQRESSQLARLFSEVTDFIYDKHIHRLTASLASWAPMFETMAGAIEAKGDGGCAGSQVFGFVEKTFLKTCRPQGNVREQRRYLDVEEKTHGISFQSLVLPNGMIADMSGPDPGGKADSDLLRRDDLNTKLVAAQEGKPFQGKVYGNSNCGNMSHVSIGIVGDFLTVPEMAYNTELSTARVEPARQVGKIVEMFPFMDLRQNQKVMLSPVGKYYMVAALLTNAHTACYGCSTSTHFGVPPPTLEEYFQN